MTDPRSFGEWLRRERERRNITIRAIADRTKIGAGLLDGLERGDVSRWPAGIYRRAFMRAYADAVGLDAELILANFERLFPDGQSEPAVAKEAAPAPASSPAFALAPAIEDEGMRMQLADMGPAIDRVAMRTVCIDVALMLGMGLGGLIAAGWIGFWCAAAVTAMVQHIGGLIGFPWKPEQRKRETAPARAERSDQTRPLASVVSFSDDQARLTSRRAPARRMAATLSAAAIPGASFRRRRAARS